MGNANRRRHREKATSAPIQDPEATSQVQPQNPRLAETRTRPLVSRSQTLSPPVKESGYARLLAPLLPYLPWTPQAATSTAQGAGYRQPHNRRSSSENMTTSAVQSMI